MRPVNRGVFLEYRTADTIIIGAGPAGLTAGYLLSKAGREVTVLEADPEYVGGISRTEKYRGYHFDIGGHRFFSKSKEVEDLWTEILPDDMLDRPRSSRIYYRGNFFAYPLKPFEALRRLGIIESALCVLSYLKVRVVPIANPRNFEEWVVNQFGRRLFSIFFKTYTEKVWGMKCTEISADWAAQRIKGLSLWSAVYNALKPKPKSRDKIIKTLIDTFRYPRKGPGMMWEACRDKVVANGGEVVMGTKVVGCAYDENSKTWIVDAVCNGEPVVYRGYRVISSAPLRELMLRIKPPVSAEARQAAQALRYRDFLTVVLILKDRQMFQDNWIYIHDPSVEVGRVQNYKSWSPEMLPDASKQCLGLEYFCFENDSLWDSSDEDLIALAKRELVKIGLANSEDVEDGYVVRQKKAYPVYDDDYKENVEVLRQELETRYPNMHLVGRNGMHKYNNQDHAMMTAMLTVKNILAEQNKYNVWFVNQDAEYHEAGKAAAQKGVELGVRQVPTRV